VYNLAYHQVRFNRSRKELFGLTKHPNLRKEISIPKAFKKGLVKCRIVYDQKIHTITFKQYTMRPINSLRIVEFDGEYPYKYENRKLLEAAFKNREDCSDVILIKNNLITDSYYANLAFKQNDTWFTPKQCLLEGTRREKLLLQDRIHKKHILLSDLDKYTHVSLFNAMIPFKEIVLRIEDIHF